MTMLIIELENISNKLNMIMKYKDVYKIDEKTHSYLQKLFNEINQKICDLRKGF